MSCCRTICSDYVKVPAICRRQAPDHHGRADSRLQGLSAPARRAHQGDRGARPRAGTGRRYPPLRHHRRPARRDRPAPRRYRAGERAGQQAQRPHRQCLSHLAGDQRHDLSSRKDGRAVDKPGAGQLIFSGSRHDQRSRPAAASLPTAGSATSSSRLGVPASEIAYMQDFKKSEAKQRLFNDFNAGKVRVLHRIVAIRWAPASTSSYA